MKTIKNYTFISWLQRSFIITVPYTWLFLFFTIPFIIVLKISFAYSEIAIPPFSELVSYIDDAITIKLNLNNYLYLLEDSIYIDSYLNSLKVAFISTIFCFLIGYPMAYAMTKTAKQTQILLLMLVLMPSWISFLIRIYSWMGILQKHGLLNQILLKIGIISHPLTILNTDIAVYIGIVYAYLPFMILPIYTNLIRLDSRYIEAAQDLGASPFQILINIVLPLSRSGIIAGSMLVFIPVVGEAVIPQLLGATDTLMIGNILWQEFFNNRDWPVASALAIIMLLVLLLPIIIFNHYQAREMEFKK